MKKFVNLTPHPITIFHDEEHPSVSHRCDLAYPGEAVRDSDGRIIGCKGLCAGPGLAKQLRMINAEDINA